jgi:hypothetical protein
MRPIQIEAWALKILDSVKAGNPVEDFRVELKSEWPVDHQRSARQIAGHANAARGEPILWLIGVDEDNGVVGATHEELANWFPKVQAEFDEIAPSMTDLNIPEGGVTIVALYFETDRAPYVVKNPSHGTEKGVSISHETPWREGTSTRSARRSDLIKMLIPVINLPEIDVLRGELTLSIVDQGNWNWYFHIETYITPQIGYPCVIPFHQCEASLEIVDRLEKISFPRIRLFPPYSHWAFGSTRQDPDSFTIRNTQNEAIIEGPGQLNISESVRIESKKINIEDSVAIINIKIRPSHSNSVIQLRETLSWNIPDENYVGKWVIKTSA